MESITNLQNSVSLVKGLLKKSYLESFAETRCDVASLVEAEDVLRGRVRILKIRQLAYNDESVIAKMSVVYQTLHGLVNSCFMMINGTSDVTSLYLGITSDAPAPALDALKQSLDGNFPGIIYESLDGTEIEGLMCDSSLGQSSNYVPTVTAVSVVPAENGYGSSEGKTQGIEKFMDAMQGKVFTAIIIATPYAQSEIENKILSLETIATSLSPLEKTTMQFSSTISSSKTDSMAKAVSNTINSNLQKGFSKTSQDGKFQQKGVHIGAGGLLPNGKINANGGFQTGFGTSHMDSFTKNISVSYGSSIGETDTVSQALMSGNSSGTALTRERIDKEVSDIQNLIEQRIVRLREGSSYGIWDCCGYFISRRNDISIVSANEYRGLVSGKGTDIQQTAMALWQPSLRRDSVSNHEVIRGIIKNLSLGIPPSFLSGDRVLRTESMVTGRELPRMMCFPLKSAGNVTIVRMSRFGRRVHYLGTEEPDRRRLFKIGQAFHMGKMENAEIYLDPEQLCEHSLIIGASGTGKTTAVESILVDCHKKQIPFTVIEPVKGEYCKKWSHIPGFKVFTVNKNKYKMLQINPFAFEESVHVLEHLERVYGVFSTAWPLFAAQPAVLRDSVQTAYIKKGWDLVNSICLFPERRFPVFQDVLDALPEVIKKGNFVGELKGTLEGAVGARVRMLTQGLYGQIFNEEYDVDDGVLFDGNTIINLEGLGSPEILSFAMGILLVRLYEHRMASGNYPSVRHLTVIEEAHNVFKKNSSYTVSQDVSSIGGRSVEVITKCVAELRSTGEGFLIVDQSPGNIDTDAIKNTSTKIVLSLREEEDIKAAASTLSLTEEQAKDLPQLSRGIAIIRQRGWAEPVLTKIEKMNTAQGMNNSVDDGIIVQKEKAIIQGFIAKRLLMCLDKKMFSVNLIVNDIRNFIGFSHWKLDDYVEKIAWYGGLYKRLGISNTENFKRESFFGRVVLDILDFKYVFKVFEFPKPEKSMKEPYKLCVNYQQKCKQWRLRLVDVMEQYATGLNTAEKDRLLYLMLLSDDASRGDVMSKNRVHVFRTLYKVRYRNN